MSFNSCSVMMHLIELTEEKLEKKNSIRRRFLIRAYAAERSFEFMLYKRSSGVTITQRRLV